MTLHHSLFTITLSCTYQLTPARLSYKRDDEEANVDFVNKSANSEFMWACECYPSSDFSVNDVKYFCVRRYQMIPKAVEVFFTSRKSIFIAFESPEKVNKFIKKLISLNPKNMSKQYHMYGNTVPGDLVHRVNPQYGKSLQEAWVNREITNFEYLMKLNLIAGRSFNDLSQYPVFPWVLADYDSKELDLRDARSYRDLRWPIGAQNQENRDTMKEYV